MAGVSFLDGPPRLPSPFMGARNKSGHDVGGRHACHFSVMPGLVPGIHGLQHDAPCRGLFRMRLG